jgi:hypothetical protein
MSAAGSFGDVLVMQKSSNWNNLKKGKIRKIALSSA